VVAGQAGGGWVTAGGRTEASRTGAEQSRGSQDARMWLACGNADGKARPRTHMASTTMRIERVGASETAGELGAIEARV